MTSLSQHPLMMSVCSVFLGVALWFVPATLTERLRTATFDALRPGLQVAQACRGQIATVAESWQSHDLRQLQDERDRAVAAQQKLQLRLDRLAAQFVIQQEAGDTGIAAGSQDTTANSLFLPALVNARVIGETLGQDWRAGRLLAEGWRGGIREESLVLHSEQPLVDAGKPEQLTVDDPLLIGSRVVGKIASVGQWTSTYLPVVDPEFRAEVQLLRETENGPAWGDKGLLRGTGDRCRIDGIAAAASVRVGDKVYNAGRDGIFQSPLVYGEVVTAELDADGREWQIEVEPAIAGNTVTRVQILRAALNPQRIWAH